MVFNDIDHAAAPRSWPATGPEPVAACAVVPGAGLEPARPEGQGLLRPPRLPIPPSGRHRRSLSVPVGFASSATLDRCRAADRCSLHLRVPHRSAAGDETERPVVLVRALTDDGEGWGECAALAVPDLLADEYAVGRLRGAARPPRPAPARRATGPAARDGDVGRRRPRRGARAITWPRPRWRWRSLDAELRGDGRSLADHLGVDRRRRCRPGRGRPGPDARRTLVERVDGARRRGLRPGQGEDRPRRRRRPPAGGARPVPRPCPAGRRQRRLRALGTRDGVPPALARLDELGLALPGAAAGGRRPGRARRRWRRALATPICLDESLTSLGRLRRRHRPSARCRVVCVKPGPLGGLDRAVAALERCRELGRRRLGAAGCSRPGWAGRPTPPWPACPGSPWWATSAGGRRFVEDDPFGHRRARRRPGPGAPGPRGRARLPTPRRCAP